MAKMFKGASMGFHVSLGSVGFKLRSEHAGNQRQTTKCYETH